MKLVVEYLVIIDKKVSEGFFKLCDSVEEFNRFLQKNRDLVIQANTIKFKQALECNY